MTLFGRLSRPAPLAAALLFASCRPAPGGDTFTISVPYELDTLDPHARNTLSNFAIVSHFYEPLVTTDAEMRVRPLLARLWETPDPSTWLFHLQPGVRFHSGRPLRARDVVYSIERLRPGSGLEMAGYVLYVEDVTALDELTVRVRTSRPVSILLNKLRFIGVVPEGAEAASLARRPDGTGPYTLAAWDRGTIRLTRNESYWSRSPALGAVEFLLDRSPEQAAEDFRGGRSQLVQANSKQPARQLAALDRARILRTSSLFLKHLSYDLGRDTTPFVPGTNPFRDRRVRQALHLAIDRERLVADLSTEAAPASQLVPSFIFGFAPSLPPPAHDPARARALLAEAGFAGGFGARLHVRKIFGEAAQLVRQQLLPLGLDFQVEVLGDEAFLDLARRRGASLWLSRFGCPTGDASDILDNALHSPDPERRMGMQNFGDYANPEVDRAIEESAGIDSVPDRRRALERIMALLMDDLVWIPLYVDQDVYALDRDYAWRPRYDSFVLAAEIRPAGRE